MSDMSCVLSSLLQRAREEQQQELSAQLGKVSPEWNDLLVKCTLSKAVCLIVPT